MNRYRYTSAFASWQEFCTLRADISRDCLRWLAPGVYAHERESLVIVINEEATR